MNTKKVKEGERMSVKDKSVDEKPAKTNKKCIHDGHRERLYKTVKNSGIENVGDIQAVEFFLTYIFPRGDVNPLAHRLLDRYGSFAAIADAEDYDLMEVLGINERSATKIAMFRELFFYYSSSKLVKVKIENKAQILDIIEENLRFRTKECLIFFALSKANYLTHHRRFDIKSTASVKVAVRELAEFISCANPFALVMAHCHPYGSSLPSEKDGEALEQIAKVCKNCNVKLVGSYILGEDGIFEQITEEKVRDFKEN